MSLVFIQNNLKVLYGGLFSFIWQMVSEWVSVWVLLEAINKQLLLVSEKWDGFILFGRGFKDDVL